LRRRKGERMGEKDTTQRDVEHWITLFKVDILMLQILLEVGDLRGLRAYARDIGEDARELKEYIEERMKGEKELWDANSVWDCRDCYKNKPVTAKRLSPFSEEQKNNFR
jgi:hypothetical protein